MQTIILAVLGSTALSSLIQFFIKRYDEKKNAKFNVKEKLATLEKDTLRTQMLLLILLKPEEQKELLTIGERYFSKPPKGLGGDWYMTSIFNKWLEENGIAEPEWFDKGEGK